MRNGFGFLVAASAVAMMAPLGTADFKPIVAPKLNLGRRLRTVHNIEDLDEWWRLEMARVHRWKKGRK